MNDTARPSHEEEIPLYPPDQAFVLQFRRGSSADVADCSGRVEHLASGKAVRFCNGFELQRFVREVLAEAQPHGREPP